MQLLEIQFAADRGLINLLHMHQALRCRDTLTGAVVGMPSFIGLLHCLLQVHALVSEPGSDATVQGLHHAKLHALAQLHTCQWACRAACSKAEELVTSD